MHRGHAFLPGAAMVVALLAIVLLASPTPANATTFNPTLQASVSDSAPGAHADISYDFYIPAPDANFGDIVSFIPPEFEVAADADIPDGAIAGDLFSDVTLGLLNSSCTTALPVEMTLYSASTDPFDGYGGDEGFYDQDGNGVIEYVEHTPYFLSELFPGVQPMHRLWGQAIVAGTWNAVQFIIFEPGTEIPFLPDMDDALGYPVVTLVNNPYGAIFVNPISDWCTPLTVDSTFFGLTTDNPQMPGNQAGHALLTNPAIDGIYPATSVVRSLWDADDDGIENNLDPCRYAPDTVWDPRSNATQGDNDGDGLPATCDPNDNSANTDIDGDGYPNRLDFCPFVDDWALDSDADDVGDYCDREPYDASDGGLSHRHAVCTTSMITIGAGGADPVAPPCPDGPDRPIISFFEPPPVLGVGQAADFGLWLAGTPDWRGVVAGVAATYSVEGANPGGGDCLSDEEGCHFEYVGTALGVDTITVSVPEFGFSETATISWEEPPANDLFANAIVIDSIPYEHTSNPVLAGHEPGEVICGYQGSTWYEFTPSADAMVKFTLDGDPYADLGVFIGNSPDALEIVYCSSHFGCEFECGSAPGPALSLEPPDTQFHFVELEAGVTYQISLESSPYYYDEEDGNVTMAMEAVTGISVGDMNCDANVNVLDSLMILRIDAGLPVPECASGWGDVNCDGNVNPVDSLILLLWDAGLIGANSPWIGLGCIPIGWSG